VLDAALFGVTNSRYSMCAHENTVLHRVQP